MTVDDDFKTAVYPGADPDMKERTLRIGINGRLFGGEARYNYVEYGSDGEGDIKNKE